MPACQHCLSSNKAVRFSIGVRRLYGRFFSCGGHESETSTSLSSPAMSRWQYQFRQWLGGEVETAKLDETWKSTTRPTDVRPNQPTCSMQYAQRPAVGGESSHTAVSHSQGHKVLSTLTTIVATRNSDNLLPPGMVTNFGQSPFLVTIVAGNGEWWHKCGQGLMRSNAATKIQSEQAGVLRWLGMGRDTSQICAARFGVPQVPMTGECSGQQWTNKPCLSRRLITCQWRVAS